MGRNDYRGLYSHNADSTVTKIAGPASAPDLIEPHMVATFFKYNLGQKEYQALSGAKSFASITDAVAIKKEF